MSESLSSLLAELLKADEEYDAAKREWDLLGPDGLGERDTRSANCPEFERYVAASSRRHDAMRATQSRPEAELPEFPNPDGFINRPSASNSHNRREPYFFARTLKAYGQQCAASPDLLSALKDLRGYAYKRGDLIHQSSMDRCMCAKCIEARADAAIALTTTPESN